jgi:hypothetical protein
MMRRQRMRRIITLLVRRMKGKGECAHRSLAVVSNAQNFVTVRVRVIKIVVVVLLTSIYDSLG